MLGLKTAMVSSGEPGKLEQRMVLHRGTGLTGFLDAIPYEPTVSFPKLPAEGKDHDRPGKTQRDDPS